MSQDTSEYILSWVRDRISTKINNGLRRGPFFRKGFFCSTGETMKVTEFDIKISVENVCKMLDADKSGDLYEEIVEELEEMLPEAYKKICPAAIFEFGSLANGIEEISSIGGDEALYGIYSVGGEISQWSTQMFAEGNYLGGMLADAIADDYLFQMDEAMRGRVLEMCKERGKGIMRRLEAPQDVPMKIQKTAFEVTHAREEIGLNIKESYMLDPVKSICQVYVLCDDTEMNRYDHDCTHCDNYTCKMRKTNVILKKDGKEKIVKVQRNKSLLDALREADIFISAVCAGRGTCGKCRVKVLKGEFPPTEEDKKIFSEEELAEGYRLACRLYPEQPCEIELPDEEEEFFVLAEGKDKGIDVSENLEYGIAVDIGTTTIAMELIELETGKIADVYTSINKQRSYGADVISRMNASNQGKGEELQKIIRNNLEEGIRYFTRNKAVHIKRMVIGANTTMVHLFMGYSCESLGVYPFKPVNINPISSTASGLFGKEDLDFPVLICPGISVFVGGDITAGLYSLEFEKRNKISVLIDLGTNGEMAIGNSEKIMVASMAAGPVFEGGNILCGLGSVPGAICKVDIQDGKVKAETIGNEKAKGICGTGVVDTVYELLKEEIIDENGLMEEEFFEDGFFLDQEENIRFCQKDVREIQLAKSAVRSGLETLVLRYGVGYEDIDRIYIAGGFGCRLDIRKAVGIGMFPEECEGKIVAVGNSCLSGVVRCLMEEKAVEVMEKLGKNAEEIPLSNDKKFQELFMGYICF